MIFPQLLRKFRSLNRRRIYSFVVVDFQELVKYRWSLREVCQTSLRRLENPPLTTRCPIVVRSSVNDFVLFTPRISSIFPVKSPFGPSNPTIRVFLVSPESSSFRHRGSPSDFCLLLLRISLGISQKFHIRDGNFVAELFLLFRQRGNFGEDYLY